MVDNVAITAGTGTTVATDDIGGVHYQRVKLAIGADGTGVDLSAGTGVDGTGVPRVTLATNVGLPAGTAALGTVKVTNAAGTVIDPVAQVAHDAVDSGEPVKIGGKAIAGLSGATLVAAADRTDLSTNLDGAVNVRTVPLEDIVQGKATSTIGTATAVIAAAGAGIKQYLTKCILVNMHATTTVYVELFSGAVSMAYVPCPPGGASITFDPPLKPNAANEAWNFTPSAAVTTLYCTLVGFKSKV